jgi:MFS family permease
VREVLVLVAGTGLVLGGLTSGAVLPTLVLVAIGVPLAAAAFVRLVPPGTVRLAPGMPAAVAVRGLLTFAFFGTNVFVPLALEEVRGTSEAVGGIAVTTATLAWTAAAWVQQHAVHAAGPRRLVRIGTSLLVVGIAGAAACLGRLPVPAAIALWTVAGFGTGLSYAPLSVTVLSRATPGQEGAATASLQLSDVLGGALGTGLGGALVAAGDDLGWDDASALLCAFAMTAAIAALASVAARRLPSAL